MAVRCFWSCKIKSEIKHLYIHIPFCYSKCHYCAFYSQLDFSDKLQNEYFHTLKRELLFYINQYNIIPETVYIGGGNPGCVPSLLNNILLFLNENFDLRKIKEFTVECNPVNATQDLVSIFKNNFVSRVSLGVQTFDEKSLLKINRVNQNNEIVGNALELLKDLNVSIDLINGLPDVDYINELNSLDACLKKYSNLNHISFYDLTIDEKSYFSIHEDEFSFPEEDRKYFFADGIETLLKSNNFVKYEISNWSRNNKVSYHNLAYWNYENYLGIGAAAHSKIENLRIENIPDIATYIDNFQHSREVYLLTEKESLEEMLLMGFRTIYGISKERLKLKCGKAENYEKLISFLINKDILDTKEIGRVVLTDNGRLFLDSVLVELFELLDSF